MYHSFTTKYKTLVNALVTEIRVSKPYDAKEMSKNKALAMQSGLFLGIWDTGATGSVITKKVVDELDLKPIGIAEVHHAKGKSKTNKYLVNIILPNKVIVENVSVTEGDLIGDIEVLIGMDIIALGDFAVTNKDSKTTLSFRTPSCTKIDFIPETDELNYANMNRAEKRKFDKLRKKFGK